MKICAEVHTKEIIPVAPYLVSLQYLDDTIAEDRLLGMEANHECFHRRYIDELWLFGDRISEGVKGEVKLALQYGIPVIPKTAGTQCDLQKLIGKLPRKRKLPIAAEAKAYFANAAKKL